MTNVYSREEVFGKTLEYFNGDTLATDVWINKYCLKRSADELLELTPVDMHHRIAKEFASIEQKYPNPLSEDEIFKLLDNFSFIVPQGSPMAGIGNTEQLTSLSNCYLIGNESDSYGGIIQAEEEMVQLMKRRGGVGLDLSHIRPEGSPVDNAAISSTGVVPFMERYSNGTREVAQDGRRGALMQTLHIKHPSAESFIDAKLDLKKVTGANISLRVTDEFMRAVTSETDHTFVQTFPIDSQHPIIKKPVDAKHLWKKIVDNNWKSAEPGVFFWDTVISESPADCYSDVGFKSVGTNPCGEIVLNIGGSCLLLVLNLYSFVKNPFLPTAFFDFDLFRHHVGIAYRLLDDIVDLEIEKVNAIIGKIQRDKEPIEIKVTELNLWENKIKRTLVKGRRIGLGVTAEADMLAALGYRYGTEEATRFSVSIHSILAQKAFQTSVTLAEERGPFPVFSYEKEKNNPFLLRLLDEADDPDHLLHQWKTFGRRNIGMLTISPTGSLSCLTQTSSGIEPVYSLFHTRRRKINPNDRSAKSDFIDELGDHWEEYNVVHPKFVTWAKSVNIQDDLGTMSPERLRKLIASSPYAKASSGEIDWNEKVSMIGQIQKYVDHSISNTTNLPSNITREEVDSLYVSAWKAGCKGCTIYRDGSRSGVLVSAEENKINIFKENHAPKRPKSLPADIMRFVNKGEKWIGVLGLLDNKPYEVFTGPSELLPIPSYIETAEIIKEKNGDGNSLYNLRWVDRDGFIQEFRGLSRTFNREFWNIGRLVSAILRHGMPIPNVILLIDKLEIEGAEHITSWKNGVKRMLKKYISDGTQVKGQTCPACHSTKLLFKDGCLSCGECGWSKC